MRNLHTPFGAIEIQIDGKPVPYVAREGERFDVLCPDVLGRYQIVVTLVPDGKRHTIACVFTPCRHYPIDHEPGERLELISFYNADRMKMSIGVEHEGGYLLDGTRDSDEYDYDTLYLANGMEYVLLPETKTDRYVFGISWIDDVGWDDPVENEGRDVQTWYGADPTIWL